ncbi:hypothetical protein DM02DRAFT_4503 [Periconia macrospinosa]|uniref:Uncharacterized protein n=1 Tax=Periconia macrospinosa TaxID=97972 RepID=A0A2V1EEA4_9PLEO|nr:hypothetical protein DM02DRAFT_4503 [Periconia macrospinosa]
MYKPCRAPARHLSASCSLFIGERWLQANPKAGSAVLASLLNISNGRFVSPQSLSTGRLVRYGVYFVAEGCTVTLNFFFKSL